MKLNKYIWNNYKETSHGKETIELFEKGETIEILNKYLGRFMFSKTSTAELIAVLDNFWVSPVIPEKLDLQGAKELFNEIIEKGIVWEDEDQDGNINLRFYCLRLCLRNAFFAQATHL